MKTIYSFQEFYNEVAELAAKKQIDYVAIRVDLTTHNKLVFWCYAHGTDWYHGPTPEAAIAKLSEKLIPPDLSKKLVDVEIEMEEVASIDKHKSEEHGSKAI